MARGDSAAGRPDPPSGVSRFRRSRGEDQPSSAPKPLVRIVAELVKRCPQCKQERPSDEEFCEGEFNGAPCGWSLSGEKIEVAGAATSEPTPPTAGPTTCPNGHVLEPGDFICVRCGGSGAT